ncbi:MAG: SMI1/KNR4 family protein [Lachnospiraceae bacterium]|nr:SMI1/KNR4 family protein [Lachnospiraceae bacterium]
MYNNYMIPENNGLKEEIRSLLEWCEKKDTEGELGNTFFEAPIEESKMTKWEEENGVKIPDSYKEWLRFTEKCRIDGTTASFWGPDEFHSEYMPENLVVIGEVVGDGEVVCFSKDTGEFMEYFEGNIEKKYSYFSGVVCEILRMMGKRQKCNNNDEFYEQLKKLKEILAKKLNGTDGDIAIYRQLKEIDERLKNKKGNKN